MCERVQTITLIGSDLSKQKRLPVFARVLFVVSRIPVWLSITGEHFSEIFINFNKLQRKITN